MSILLMMWWKRSCCRVDAQVLCATIQIKILDSNKRPAIINLDNREFGNIKDITIKCNSDNKTELLLDNFNKFKLKILKEQFT